MQFTGLGKEETSIKGSTPKRIFLFSSDSVKYASEKNFKCMRNLARPRPYPGSIKMEFSFERFVTERDEDWGKSWRNGLPERNTTWIDYIHVLIEGRVVFNSKCRIFREYMLEHMSRREAVCLLQIIQKQSPSGRRQAKRNFKDWRSLWCTRHKSFYPSTDYLWQPCII